jgi:outer membrane murein-binding lipoprotein Lpp
MTDTAMLKKQISMQATRLAECIRKINQLTSDLHQAREEVTRLKDQLDRAKVNEGDANG